MKKIDSWFDDLNKLIQDSFIAHKHLSIVHEQKSKLKFLNEDFFVFFQYQQFFMLNIQLAKIFEAKQTQKRNIRTLFQKIISGQFSEEITLFLADGKKTGLTYKQFIQQIKELNSSIKTHQKIIDKVSKARNKIYAHTDINRMINFPTIEELKLLIDLAANLYNNSRGKLYGIHTDFTRGINNLTINYVIKVIQHRTEKAAHNTGFALVGGQCE